MLTETFMYLVFFAGQLLHLLERADGTAKSSLPNGVKTIREFVVKNKYQIVGQVFLALVVYWLVIDNPKVVNIEALGTGYKTRLALAGALGWFADSFSDKVFKRLGLA